MRKIIYILLVLPVCIAADWADSECLDKFNKVVGYYKQSINDKSYIKFSFQTEDRGEKSEAIVSEIWQDGVKYKMDSPMMTAFQDASTVIIVAKSTHVISIYPNINGSKGAGKEEMIRNNLMNAFTKDSIAKYFTNITCKEQGSLGELKVDLKNSYAEQLGYSSMIYKYDSKAQQIKENIIESANEDGVTRSYYKYLVMTTKFPETVLTTNVINQVYSGNTLRAEYKGYKVMDYRSKEKNNK
jgi:hypothetical protein